MGDFTTARTDLDKYAFGQLPRLKLSNEKVSFGGLHVEILRRKERLRVLCRDLRLSFNR